MKKVLTIAGSDCSGGAGIQADLKTMMAHRVYGMSVITAITAQNTKGITAVETLSPDLVSKQLDAVFTDLAPDAVKIGMIGTKAIGEVILDKLSYYKPKHVVIDPVMISTSGHKLLTEEAGQLLVQGLFKQGTLITPNIPEAEFLEGCSIHSKEDMEAVAQELYNKHQVSFLIKGGHFSEGADDLLITDGQLHWYTERRIENENTHGTGCTLSSAIACQLALGKSLPEAVALGKYYMSQIISAKMDLGAGRGPLNHFAHVVRS